MASAISLTCGSNRTGICSSNGAKSYYVDENGNLATVGTISSGDVSCGDLTACNVYPSLDPYGDVDCQALTCTSFNTAPARYSCVFTMDSNDGGNTGTFHLFDFTIARYGYLRFMTVLPTAGRFSVKSNRPLEVRLNNALDFSVIPVADRPVAPLFADFCWKYATGSIRGKICITAGTIKIGMLTDNLYFPQDLYGVTELGYQQVIAWTVNPSHFTPVP